MPFQDLSFESVFGVEEPTTPTSNEDLDLSFESVFGLPQEPEEDQGYGFRVDGTPKGSGWLGLIDMEDGRVMSEVTVGVEFDGREVQIPSLVPGLSDDHIDYLKRGGDPRDNDEIMEIAVGHARQRMGEGLSPFKEEKPKPAKPTKPTKIDWIDLLDKDDESDPDKSKLFLLRSVGQSVLEYGKDWVRSGKSLEEFDEEYLRSFLDDDFKEKYVDPEEWNTYDRLRSTLISKQDIEREKGFFGGIDFYGSKDIVGEISDAGKSVAKLATSGVTGTVKTLGRAYRWYASGDAPPLHLFGVFDPISAFKYAKMVFGEDDPKIKAIQAKLDTGGKQIEEVVTSYADVVDESILPYLQNDLLRNKVTEINRHLDDPRTWVQSSLEGAGSMIPILAAGIVTGGPGVLIVGFGMGGDQIYDGVREVLDKDPNLSEEEKDRIARKYAVYGGAVSAALEGIGAMKILGAGKGKTTVSQYFKDVLSASITEGLTEAAQTSLEQTLNYMADPSIPTELRENIALKFLKNLATSETVLATGTGMIVGGTAAGTAGGARRISDDRLVKRLTKEYVRERDATPATEEEAAPLDEITVEGNQYILEEATGEYIPATIENIARERELAAARVEQTIAEHEASDKQQVKDTDAEDDLVVIKDGEIIQQFYAKGTPEVSEFAPEGTPVPDMADEAFRQANQLAQEVGGEVELLTTFKQEQREAEAQRLREQAKADPDLVEFTPEQEQQVNVLEQREGAVNALDKSADKQARDEGLNTTHQSRILTGREMSPFAKRLRAMGRRVGLDVVVTQTEATRDGKRVMHKFTGMLDPNDSRRMILDDQALDGSRKSQQAMLTVMGHEFFHSLEKESPDLVDALMATMPAGFRSALQQYRATGMIGLNPTQQQQVSEGFAQLLENTLLGLGTESLLNKDVGKVRQVKDFIRRMLTRLGLSGQYGKDVLNIVEQLAGGKTLDELEISPRQQRRGERLRERAARRGPTQPETAAAPETVVTEPEEEATQFAARQEDTPAARNKYNFAYTVKEKPTYVDAHRKDGTKYRRKVEGDTRRGNVEIVAKDKTTARQIFDARKRAGEFVQMEMDRRPSEAQDLPRPTVRVRSVEQIDSEEAPAQFAARREPDETTDRKPELTVSDVEKEIESEPGTVLDAEISDDAFQDVDDTDVQFAARQTNIPYINDSELKGKRKFVYFADRMQVGLYTGLNPKSGINIELQGGPAYPFIEGQEGVAAWAFTDPGMFQRFVRRVDATDGIGLVTLYAPGSVRGNHTFLRAYFAELDWAIKSKKLTQARALQELNNKRKSSLTKPLFQKKSEWIQSWKTPWKSLQQAEEAIKSATFEARTTALFPWKKTANVKSGNHSGQMASDVLVKEGFPDVTAMVKLMEDPAFEGMPYGSVVAAVEFEKGQTTHSTAEELGIDPHLSYSVVIRGRGLGYLKNPKFVLDLVDESIQTKKSPIRSAETSMAGVQFAARPADERQLGVLYSQLGRVMRGAKQRKWDAGALRAYLVKNGVKQEEMFWTGLDDYLKENPKVDLDEAMDAIGSVQLDEKMRGVTSEYDQEAKSILDKHRVVKPEIVILQEGHGGTYNAQGPDSEVVSYPIPYYSELQREIIELDNKLNNELTRRLQLTSIDADEQGLIVWNDEEDSYILPEEEYAPLRQLIDQQQRGITEGKIPGPGHYRDLKPLGYTDAPARFDTRQEAQAAFPANLDQAADAIANASQDRWLQESLNVEKLWGITDKSEMDLLSSWAEEKRSFRADDEGQPKFESYTLPGGEDYRELTISMPMKNKELSDVYKEAAQRVSAMVAAHDVPEYMTQAEWEAEIAQAEIERDDALRAVKDAGGTDVGYKSHSYPERNILVWIRFNTRIGPNGEKILFIEEIQSDWHQEGREEGYLRPSFKTRNRVSGRFGQSFDTRAEAEAYVATLPESIRGNVDVIEGSAGQVPDAPFKKTWTDLALKRIVAYAVGNGFDGIAWTTGDQQARRYEKIVAENVDEIIVTKNERGNYTLGAMKEGRGETWDVQERDLNDYIGKDMATEVRDRMAAGEQSVTIPTEDFKVGGKGMGVYYGGIVSQAVNKIGKKFGTRVGKLEMDTGTQPSLVFPEKLKGAVPEFAQFAARQPKRTPTTKERVRKITGQTKGRGLRELREQYDLEELMTTLPTTKAEETRQKRAIKLYRQIAEKRRKVNESKYETLEEAMSVAAGARGVLIQTARNKQNQLKQDFKDIEGMQNDLRRFMQMLPKEVRGKYLSLLTRVKNVNTMRQALRDVIRLAAKSGWSDAVDRFEKAAKLDLSKLPETVRKSIEDLITKGKQQRNETYKTKTGDVRIRKRIMSSSNENVSAAEDLNETTNSIREQHKAAMGAKRELKEGRAATQQELNDQVLNDIETAHKPINTDQRKRLGRIKSSLRKRIVNAHRHIHNIVKSITADFGGDLWMHEVMVNQVRDAETAMNREKHDIMTILETSAKEAGFDSLTDAGMKLGGTHGDGNATWVSVTIGGQEFEILLGEALHYYLMDPQTRASIEGGAKISSRRSGEAVREMHITPEEVEAIIAQVPNEVKQFGDAMKDILQYLGPRIIEKIEDIKGWSPDLVIDYWPMHRDLRGHAARIDKVLEAVMNGTGTLAEAFTLLVENSGMTIQRETISTATLYMEDAMTTFGRHLDTALRIIHMAEVIRTNVELLNDSRITNAIIDNHGEHVVRALRDGIVSASGLREAPQRGTLDRIMRSGLSNFQKSLVMAYPKTWAIQFSGIPRFFGRFGVRDMTLGVAWVTKAIAKGNLSSTLEQNGFFIDRWSQSTINRFSPQDYGGVFPLDGKGFAKNSARALVALGRGLKETLKTGRVTGDYLKEAQRFWSTALDSIAVLDAIDKIICGVAYGAARAKLKRETNLSGTSLTNESLRLAEYEVRETQNSSSGLDKATMAQSHGNSLVGQAFLMFSSDKFAFLNRLEWALHQIKSGNRSAGIRSLAGLSVSSVSDFAIGRAWVFYLPALMAAMFGDDDDRKKGERIQKSEDSFWADIAMQFIGMSPIVGPVVQEGVAIVADEVYGGDLFENPIGEVVGNVGRNVGKAYKEIEALSDDEIEANITKMMTRAGIALMEFSALTVGNPGFPVISKLLRGAEENLGDPAGQVGRLDRWYQKTLKEEAEAGVSGDDSQFTEEQLLYIDEVNSVGDLIETNNKEIKDLRKLVVEATGEERKELLKEITGLKMERDAHALLVLDGTTSYTISDEAKESFRALMERIQIEF